MLLGDRLNAGAESEAALTAGTRNGWIKLEECGELFNGRKLSLKMKRLIYRSCARSAMLYRSETWSLREDEMAIMKELKKQW